MTWRKQRERSRKRLRIAMFAGLLFALLACGSPAAARIRPLRKIKHFALVLHKKPWFQPIEHAAIGAGVGFAVSEAAGGVRNWQPGLLGAAITAGFKEGSDAWAGRDNIPGAALDAAEIAAGAGALAAYGATR